MGGNTLVAGLEQGAIALLGSKSTQALLRLTPHAELALFCCALVAALHRIAAGGAPVLGRVSALMAQVLSSIALNTLLQWAADSPDAGLACLTLLTVFFWGGALDPDGTISVTAQYLLVATLVERLGPESLLPVAWALAFAPGLGTDVAELAQLVTAESTNLWLRAWMPPSLLLPSAAVLLYLCAPFTEQFPALGRVYRFAVFALTSDRTLARTPAWLIAAGLWALWQAEPDPVSRRLAAVAGCNFAVLVALDAMQFAMDNDPAVMLVALAIAIRIGEEASQAAGR